MEKGRDAPCRRLIVGGEKLQSQAGRFRTKKGSNKAHYMSPKVLLYMMAVRNALSHALSRS
jgi:hypothetical protein